MVSDLLVVIFLAFFHSADTADDSLAGLTFVLESDREFYREHESWSVTFAVTNESRQPIGVPGVLDLAAGNPSISIRRPDGTVEGYFHWIQVSSSAPNERLLQPGEVLASASSLWTRRGTRPAGSYALRATLRTRKGTITSDWVSVEVIPALPEERWVFDRFGWSPHDIAGEWMRECESSGVDCRARIKEFVEQLGSSPETVWVLQRMSVLKSLEDREARLALTVDVVDRHPNHIAKKTLLRDAVYQSDRLSDSERTRALALRYCSTFPDDRVARLAMDQYLRTDIDWERCPRASPTRPPEPESPEENSPRPY